MKAHIVGGGFGGLTAAAYLVRDVGMSGQDITVNEADDRLGGVFSLAGDAATGYILPTGAVLWVVPLHVRPSRDNPLGGRSGDFRQGRFPGLQ